MTQTAIARSKINIVGSRESVRCSGDLDKIFEKNVGENFYSSISKASKESTKNQTTLSGVQGKIQ